VAARLAAAEIIAKRQEFSVTEGREVTDGFGSQVSDLVLSGCVATIRPVPKVESI
jgi:hypothetical protein